MLGVLGGGHGSGGHHGGGGGGGHHGGHHGGGGGRRPAIYGPGGAYFAGGGYGPWGYPGTDVYIEPSCDLIDQNGNCVILGGPRIVGRPRVLLGTGAIVAPEADAEPGMSQTETTRMWVAVACTLTVVALAANFKR